MKIGYAVRGGAFPNNTFFSDKQGLLKVLAGLPLDSDDKLRVKESLVECKHDTVRGSIILWGVDAVIIPCEIK